MNEPIPTELKMNPSDRERVDANRRVAFECLYEHLHMHDKHLYQVLTIFSILIGAVLYNLDKMRAAQPYTAAFVLLWGILFYLLTWRIAHLVTKIRQRLEEVSDTLDLHPVLPVDYGRRWVRTAHIGMAMIVVGTLATTSILFVVDHRPTASTQQVSISGPIRISFDGTLPATATPTATSTTPTPTITPSLPDKAAP